MQVPTDTLETALEAGLLDDALQRIPSVFGRLLCIAPLIKSQSADPGHQPESRQWRELCTLHLAAFEEWLALSLKEKYVDMELCAASQDCSVASLLQSWASPENQKELFPRWALTLQRDLFALDLEALLQVSPRNP